MLHQIGGAAGVGITFLEDAFSASTSFPKHRMHEFSARRVLDAMLPDSATNIKGHMVSSDELMAASGYTGLTRTFGDLINILDSELRLITPTEVISFIDANDHLADAPSGGRHVFTS